MIEKLGRIQEYSAKKDIICFFIISLNKYFGAPSVDKELG